MHNNRCKHNNWHVDCDKCDLERLQAKYEAVCGELEVVQQTINRTESVICKVTNAGTIHPFFKCISDGTSGYLKYFHNIANKTVKISIEVLDD